MAFTPFHFGVGAAIKGLFPRNFSFTVFCFAQMVTDTEVIFYLARDEQRLHRFLHTCVGAALVAAFSTTVGRSICRKALQMWRASDEIVFKSHFETNPQISWPSAFTGAVLGTSSHLLLDSIMHADTAPFSPFSPKNPFFGIIGAGTLHAICFLLGITGVWLCVAQTKREQARRLGTTK